MANQKNYLVSSNTDDDTLTQKIKGFDQDNKNISTKVIKEGAITIFLNKQEIVTLMCILDHPKYLAIGYLLNQDMIKKDENIKSVSYDKQLNIVVVRTNKKTNFEKV